jgi:hypothetical protein
MRTLSRLAVLCVVVAGTGGITTGCDDTSLGHLKDPAGPPRLIKALVQDSAFVGGPPVERGAVADLLDTAPPPSCSDLNPCINQFLVAQNTPPLDCSDPSGGVCIDPLAVPSAGVPLNAGASAIRLVFNKLLDASIESVTVDANGAPTGAKPYTLASGIVELLGPDGAPVAGTTAFWDNSGSPEFTSDVILIPFGPAIVILPGSLDPSTAYTIRIHPARLKDRDGHPAADAAGAVLTDPTDLRFTTEPITPNPDLSFPDFSTAPATLAPNEVLQLAFFATLDETTVALTATGPAGFDPALVEAYADRGSSPAMADCAAAENDAVLDFVYTSGAGAARMPADWPAGDYTLSFTVKDSGGRSTYSSPPLHFTVAGADADPTTDANAAAAHVTPEECL